MVGAGLGQRIQQRRRKYTYDDTRCPASLVCPFQRKGREIFVTRGQGLTLPPHMCRALLRFSHLSFMPPPYPPLRGTFP